MAITTNIEANAVGILARLLLPGDKPTTSEGARDALGVLSEAARKKLMTGVSNKEVAELWDRRQVLSQVAKVLYGEDYTTLLSDLATTFGVAVAHLDRAWFEEYREAELTDEQWEALRPLLSRYPAEVGETWINERFADDALEDAGIGKPEGDQDAPLDEVEENPEMHEEEPPAEETVEPGSEEPEEQPDPAPDLPPACEEEEDVDLLPNEEEVDLSPEDEEVDEAPAE